MKKILSVLGGIFLVILVVVLGFGGYAAVKSPKLYAESKAYVEATLPALLANFTSEKFASYMTPQEGATLNTSAFESVAFFQRQSLGAFESCENIKSDRFLLSVMNSEVRARHLVRCHFEKASVTVAVAVEKTGEAWYLTGVHFDTSTLGPAVQSNRSVRAEAAPPASDTHTLPSILPGALAHRRSS
jgi:hypothetical protein